MRFFRRAPLSRGISEDVNTLYQLSDSEVSQSFDLAESIRNKVLKRIYEKFDVKREIEPSLFSQTFDTINHAVDLSFGEVQFGEPNYEFVQALKRNNAVFAAFKTHRQQNDLAQLLVDDKGTPRSYSDFRKAANPIIGTYNAVWLKTEYNTAVKVARTAAIFADAERDRDLYPNLKWLPSRAVEPRSSHKAYYNMVRAFDDPFWSTCYPGNEWGCQCDVQKTDTAITDSAEKSPKKEEGVKGLDKNPYHTESIFSASHPYVTNGYGSLRDRKVLAELSADSAMIRLKAEEVIATRRTHGTTFSVGKLDKEVVKVLKREEITPASKEIILSDKAIQHMTRDAKKELGHAPSVENIGDIASLLDKAEVYWDTKNRNLLYIAETEGNECLKFVVAPNYKYKVNGKKMDINYVVTGGYIDRSNKHQAEYIKIKN
jgi:hypothetical protein